MIEPSSSNAHRPLPISTPSANHYQHLFFDFHLLLLLFFLQLVDVESLDSCTSQNSITGEFEVSAAWALGVLVAAKVLPSLVNTA